MTVTNYHDALRVESWNCSFTKNKPKIAYSQDLSYVNLFIYLYTYI